MAATIVQQNSNFATAATLSVTLGAGTTAGNTLFIVANGHTAITTPTGFTADVSVTANSGHGILRIFRKATTAGETAWTVTTDTDGGAWSVLEVSGLLSSPLDQTATGTGGAASTTSVATGTTPTTTVADEWNLAAVSGVGILANPGTFSGWTNSFVERSDGPGATSGSYRHTIATATLAVAATGAYTTTATASVATYLCAGIATYKLAASDLPPPPLQWPARNRAANY